MTAHLSTGITRTESFLFQLCQKSFLRLWSYSNPFKDDGHEFCDVIVVFGKHVLILFDREKLLKDFEPEEDPQIRWQRWKRNVIDKQISTAHGAERYLRAGRSIYLDAKRAMLLPTPINSTLSVVHKIVVAHGAAEACKNFSEENVSGSLAVSYGIAPCSSVPCVPFIVDLDKKNPIHVLDAHSLPLVLGQLDTITDFLDYITAKERAISKYDFLAYCGEEDLVAHYLLNYDNRSKSHLIGTKQKSVNGLFVGEGEWQDFIQLPQYKLTTVANAKSYLWDDIIDRTAENWLNGKLLGDGSLLSRPSAIFEMAKEPRFMRRSIVEHIDEVVQHFPRGEGCIRHICFFGSHSKTTAYVFMQLWVPHNLRGDEAQHRQRRQEILRIACGAAKNRFTWLQTVVGIGIEPPTFTREVGEDLIWMDCREWSDRQAQEIESRNENFRFFKSAMPKRRRQFEFVSARPLPNSRTEPKPGRNDQCPCGSGRKYKKCHGARVDG